MYYIYVLKSIKDQKLYTGVSSNLRTRIKAHNEGRVRATKNRRPLQLIYYEAYLHKKDATQREHNLKHKTEQRKFLKRQIQNSFLAPSSSG